MVISGIYGGFKASFTFPNTEKSRFEKYILISISFLDFIFNTDCLFFNEIRRFLRNERLP